MNSSIKQAVGNIVENQEPEDDKRPTPKSFFDLCDGSMKPLTVEEIETILKFVNPDDRNFSEAVDDRVKALKNMDHNKSAEREVLEDMSMLQLLGERVTLGRLAGRLVATLVERNAGLKKRYGHLVEDRS